MDLDRNFHIVQVLWSCSILKEQHIQIGGLDGHSPELSPQV